MSKGTEVSAVPQGSLSKALAEIEAVKTGVGDLAIRLNAIQIKNQDDYDGAAMALKEANLAVKKFELKRDELTREAKAFVERVRDTVKAIVTTIETSMNNVKAKGNAWIREENDRKQREIAKAALEREKAAQTAVAADTKKEQNKALAFAAKADAKIETLQAAKPGNAGRRRVFRVVDSKAVPREYLVVDESAIRKIMGRVDTPFPVIAGVEFEDVQEMRA